ncbi:MAG: site-2 protease family protein [Candidatus Diapherotrites archaeon]
MEDYFEPKGMSERERNDLLISWFTISIAFAFVLGPGFLRIVDFLYFLPISFVAVGTAFVFHELAHRQIARKFGCYAEFRAWTWGLVLSIALPLLSFGRFLFAAPGAVYIYGPHISRKQNGLISISGPATNILVGIVFFVFWLYAIVFMGLHPYLLELLITVSQINFFLAFFNLIPIPPLDGSKVISWNAMAWLGAISIPFFFIFVLPMLPHLLGF